MHEQKEAFRDIFETAVSWRDGTLKLLDWLAKSQKTSAPHPSSTFLTSSCLLDSAIPINLWLSKSTKTTTKSSCPFRNAISSIPSRLRLLRSMWSFFFSCTSPLTKLLHRLSHYLQQHCGCHYVKIVGRLW